MGIVDNALIGASGQGGYFLQRSLRLRQSASASLTRTPVSSSSQNRWTWSGWVKRGRIGVTQTIFSAYSAASYQTYINFTSSDTLQFNNFWGSDNENIITTQVFRDPSAWYHLVFSINLSASTYQNAVQMFVNGVQITAFSTTTFTNSFNAGAVNGNYPHSIGSYATQSSNYADLYLAEVNFVDGQQLLPSSFGSTNPVTGVWQPRKYGGTYGTNGFYLPFTDNSGATATTIGKDFSGNGNNWTPNNISVTSGVTYDSMTDVPTLTSPTAANFAVLNPLNTELGMTGTLAGGNLDLSGSGGKRSTIAARSGKWYWEFRVNSGASANFPISGLYVAGSGTYWPGYDGNSFGYFQGGAIYYNGSTSLTVSSYTDGDVLGFAWDADTGKVYVAKNGTWQNSGNPAAGTGQVATVSTGVDRVVGAYNSSGSCSINFGQQPFSYTPPTGFVALNTFNLPDSTIKNGRKEMDVLLVTGTGANQAYTGLLFEPGLSSIKSRSASGRFDWFDSLRGPILRLDSSTTEAEAADNDLYSFDTNGFGGSLDNGTTYASWHWRTSTTTVTNTSGTITSSVRANPTAGISVVTYTGTGANATVGHGLGIAPQMMIFKIRNAVDGWGVYHVSMGNTQTMYLESTSAAVTSSTYWNNTSPTSSVFSLGTWGRVNNSGNTYVAYCFAPISGFSSFGAYTGNGSSDGPFIYTGFRPKYIMVKVSSTTNWWIVFDSVRNTYNAANFELAANLSNAEYTATTGAYTLFDFLSNGFKLRTGSLEGNSNGQTYIYMAFAENPFKNALAR
jgi:hypothetical protein